MTDFITPGAILITLVALGIMILWEQPFIKSNKAFNWIQGPLLAVIAGITLNVVLTNTPLGLSADQAVSIPVAGSLGEFFSQFTFPDFSQWNNPDVYMIGLTIAVVASLETLLCVEATDKLDPHKRTTPTNRELIAQGVGNMVSGAIGGLPITQVIVRSSANIQSGGQTKASAFFHGILLLVSVMSIPRLLNLIPLASLAAILFVVGYKLAKPSLFKEMYKKGVTQFVPFMITIVGIVFTDLLIGIGLGMAVAVIQILWNNYKRPFHFDPNNYEKGKPIRIELSEDVSFLNKASILNTLNHMPEDTHVIIDTTKSTNIHPDVIEIIENFEFTAFERNITTERVDHNPNSSNNPMNEFSNSVLENQPSSGKSPLNKQFYSLK